MQITKSIIQRRSPLISVLVAVLVCVLVKGGLATAGTYANSAHGNTDPGYGVNRTDAGHAIGDCAHCHDTFSASTCGQNQLLLFAPMNPISQTDNLCLLCHKGDGSVQVGGVVNNDYSAKFGGASPIYDNMYDAFNAEPEGSSHSLEDIQSFLAGGSLKTANGTEWSLEVRNPCDACHNPHIARKNNNDPYDAAGAAISRPSDHNALWGDDNSERMNSFTSKYQAPYWVGWSSYEPADDSVDDGSNLPDYVTFCTDCHNTYNTIYSSSLDRDLKYINWGASGDKHGGRDAAENEDRDCYDLVSPYSEDLKQAHYNYVLSCTDCHEPHGSSAPFLLRMQVSGDSLSYSGSLNGFYNQLCYACHVWHTCGYGSPCFGAHPGPSGDCAGCHYHGPPALCPQHRAKMF